MKQVMYGIRIADVNQFGGWVGYEPIDHRVANTLNDHMYLFFQNEYHILQFAEGRKFVINIKDDKIGRIVEEAHIIKAIVEFGTTLSMNGYEISAPAYARNVVKPLSRATHFIPESDIYTFSDQEYKEKKTDFNFIADLMTRTSIEDVDVLLGSISFVNKNLLYHYPHYFIIGDSQIQVLNPDYKII